MAESKIDIERLLNKLKASEKFSSVDEFKAIFNYAIENNEHSMVEKIISLKPSEISMEAGPNSVWEEFFLSAANKGKVAFIVQMEKNGVKFTADLFQLALKKLFEKIQNVPYFHEKISNTIISLLNFANYIDPPIPIDLNWHTSEGRSPLSIALAFEPKAYSLFLFKEDESNDDERSHFLNTVLAQHGLDVNFPNVRGLGTQYEHERRLIDIAITQCHWANVFTLLEKGADFVFKTEITTPYDALFIVMAQKDNTPDDLKSRERIFRKMLKLNSLVDPYFNNINIARIMLNTITFGKYNFLNIILEQLNSKVLALPVSSLLIKMIEQIVLSKNREQAEKTLSVIALLLKHHHISFSYRDPRTGKTAMELADSLDLPIIKNMLLERGAPGAKEIIAARKANNLIAAEKDNLPYTEIFEGDPEYGTSYGLTKMVQDETIPFEHFKKVVESYPIGSLELRHAWIYAAEFGKFDHFSYISDLIDPNEISDDLKDMHEHLQKNGLLNRREEVLQTRQKALAVHQQKHGKYTHGAYDLGYYKHKEAEADRERVEHEAKEKAAGTDPLLSYQFDSKKELRNSRVYQPKFRPDVMKAIANNDEKALINLVTRGANLNYDGSYDKSSDIINLGGYALDLTGYTPLHFAMYSGNPTMVNLLLELGASAKLADEKFQEMHHKPLKEMQNIPLPIKARIINRIHRAEKTEMEADNKSTFKKDM